MRRAWIRRAAAAAGCLGALVTEPSVSGQSGAMAPSGEMARSDPKQGAVELPFEHGRFHILYVKAQINGREATMLLDTGARFSVVRPEIVGMSPIDLKVARFSKDGPGFGGEAIGFRTTVRLGDKTWRDHVVSVMDMSEVDKVYERRVDGLLGEDLLCKFRRAEFDYAGGVIRLFP
jgi:hypothetical protein